MNIQYNLNLIKEKYKYIFDKYNLYFLDDDKCFYADDIWKRNDDKFVLNGNPLIIARRRSNDDCVGVIVDDNHIKHIILIHGWENGFYSILNVYKSFDALLLDEKNYI